MSISDICPVCKSYFVHCVCQKNKTIAEDIKYLKSKPFSRMKKMTVYKTSKGRSVKTISAAGTEGLLIRTLNGEVRFRVYYDEEDKSKFIDYSISHNDMKIKISEDCDATFYYNEDGKAYIDHGPEALGLEVDAGD